MTQSGGCRASAGCGSVPVPAHSTGPSPPGDTMVIRFLSYPMWRWRPVDPCAGAISAGAAMLQACLGGSFAGRLQVRYVVAHESTTDDLHPSVSGEDNS